MPALFKSPRVLVTNNYLTALKFINNDSKSSKDVSLDIDDKKSLLLNPFDESKSSSNSYYIFDSLEYSLGYGDAAGQDNYKVILKLNDYFSDLEETFVHNLLSWNQLLNTSNLFETDLKSLDQGEINEVRKSSIAGDGINLPTENSFSDPEQNIQKTLTNNLIGKSYYFIFINEDGEYLDPIVSQFYAATVSQSSKKIGMYAGIKQVKLEFICTGHPNILSNLADLSRYTPSQLASSPYRNIPSQFYQIREKIDFKDLLKEPKKIDVVVKNIIKKLFQTITGKEVILVLPDFSKLFSYFKLKFSKSPVYKGLQVSTENPNLINPFLKNADYYLLQVFFNKLGFNCIAPSIVNVFAAYESLSVKDRNELEEVNKKIDAAIEEITKNTNLESLLEQLFNQYKNDKTIFGISFRTKGISAYSGQLDNIKIDRQLSFVDETFFSYLKKILKQRSLPQGEGLLGDLVNKDKPINEEDIKKYLKDLLYRILERKLQDKGFYNAIRNRVSPRSPQADKLSSELDAQKVLDSASGLLTFTISSEQQNQQNLANPKVKNQIDFYEFANSLSNRLQVIGDFPYKISFTEENDLYRLTKVLPFLFSYENFKGANTKTTPLLTNTGQPAIVLFESFMYDNYYLPIDGVPRSSPNVGTQNTFEYPLSDADQSNYATNSAYFNVLRQRKKKQAKFHYRSINLPFSKFPMSNVLPTGNLPLLIEDRIKELNRSDMQIRFSGSIDRILEVMKKWKSEKLVQNLEENSINTISIFHYDPNYKNSLVDNIIEYNVRADTMNSTAPLYALVQKIQNQIFDDKLLDQRINKYTELFVENFTEIRNKMIGFLGKPNELSEYKKSLEQSLSKNLDNLKDPTTGIDPLIPQVRVNTTDTSKLTPEEKKEYDKALESQEEDYVKRTVNQLLVDCVQDSLRWDDLDTKGTKIINSFLGDKSLIRANLYKMIYEKIYQVELETFPFFQINSIGNLNSPVLLVIKKNLSPMAFGLKDNLYRANDLAKQISEGRFYSLLTGMYIVVGFKHTLTGTSAKSNFVLRKSLTSGSEG